MTKSIKDNESILAFHAGGNRIAKHVHTALGVLEKSTYYVRDASGNVMATYEHMIPQGQTALAFDCTERPIYGSSRVGMDVSTVELISTPAGHPGIRRLGEKLYELSNHLGNVLSVINDVKLPVNSSGTVISYTPVVVSAQDYSPFGVVLKGRNWSTEDYRYGFQNQEQDEELWEGAVTFKYRLEDARLGRFFSVDPLYYKYPHNSCYAFSENKLIAWQELEGLESHYTNYLEKSNEDPKLAEERLRINQTPILAGTMVVAATGSVALIEYGVATCLAYAASEMAEEVFEVVTGIPVLVDPMDFFQLLIKKGYKRFARDVFVNGRKFGSNIPIQNLYDYAFNCKKYGNFLADAFFDGKLKLKKGASLLNEELRAAQILLKEGKTVTKNVDGVGGDFDVGGVNWEVKKISGINLESKDPINNLKKRIVEGGGQSSNVFIDMIDQDGFTSEQAMSAAKRAFGSNSNLSSIRIVGKGFDFTLVNPSKK